VFFAGKVVAAECGVIKNKSSTADKRK